MTGVLLEAGTSYPSRAHSWVYPLFLVGSVLLIILVFCLVFYLSSFCVLCAHCCQCLWIVRCWFCLRFSRRFVL